MRLNTRRCLMALALTVATLMLLSACGRASDAELRATVSAIIATNSGTATALADPCQRVQGSALFFVNDTLGWAAGSCGHLQKTEDGGRSWRTLNSESTGFFRALYFVSVQVGWLVGDEGLILNTQDGGASWRKQESGTDEDLRDVFFVDELNGTAVGDNGVIVRTEDGGASWRDVTNLTDTDLSAIYFSDRDNGWIIGQQKTLLKTKDGGKRWALQKWLPAEYHDVYFLNASVGFLTGYNHLLKTVDGGKIWEEYEVTQPENLWTRLKGIQFVDSERGWLLGEGRPTNFWSTQPTYGACETMLFETNDGGHSWQVIWETTEGCGDGVALWAVKPQRLLLAGPPARNGSIINDITDAVWPESRSAIDTRLEQSRE